ncbi:hypothetical protein J1614_009997 [Plenodomus biglobosus]|nr:hypothetical protein J1614_009997 [Plenodomus biglobosus]
MVDGLSSQDISHLVTLNDASPGGSKEKYNIQLNNSDLDPTPMMLLKPTVSKSRSKTTSQSSLVDAVLHSTGDITQPPITRPPTQPIPNHSPQH